MAQIRNIEEKDLEQLAILHKSSFDKNHFTHYFSPGMLKNYLSVFLRHNEECILFEEENKILGYIIGGNRIQTALNEFLKKNRLKLVLVLMINPSFILEKMSFIIGKVFGSKNTSVFSPVYKIYIIAVSGEASGKGIGTKLIKHFEEILSSKKINNYTLSVRKNNPAALSFYQKLGFIEINRKAGTIYLQKDLVR